jgi:hypothetical protein
VKEMKVIFLDFDGVICTGRQAIASGERGVISGLDPVALGFLNRVCSQNDLKVVISSTWRCGDKRRNFYEIFGCGGYVSLARALHDNWATPITPHMSRGGEIELWLADNECDGYVIIDDDASMLDYQLPFFVNTDSLNGMLYDHYKQVLKILDIKD